MADEMVAMKDTSLAVGTVDLTDTLLVEMMDDG